MRRVRISGSGYECSDCKHPCDPERKERIEAARKKLEDEGGGETGDQGDVQKCNPKKLANEEGGETDDQHDVRDSHLRYPSHCSKCGNTAWVWNMLLGTYDPCTDCQPNCLSVY